MIFVVTPCVGVWIEILVSYARYLIHLVTPCVGVWIEIVVIGITLTPESGHSLRGSVD